MSAITVGYPDGQRVVQTQPLELAFQLNTATKGIVKSSAIYIGNHTSVLCNLKPGPMDSTVDLNWYADQALTQMLGTEEIGLSTFLQTPADVLVSAGGPWLQIVITPGTLTVFYQPAMFFFLGTQTRTHRVISPFVYTMSTGAFNLAANASQTQTANGYSSGRHGCSVASGSTGVKIALSFWQPILKFWAPISNYTLAANLVDYREFVLPATAIQMILTNASTTVAGTNFQATIWQDL